MRNKYLRMKLAKFDNKPNVYTQNRAKVMQKQAQKQAREGLAQLACYMLLLAMLLMIAWPWCVEIIRFIGAQK